MLLENTRELTKILRQKGSNEMTLDCFCETMHNIIGAEVYILSAKGETIGLTKKGLLKLEIGELIKTSININLTMIQESVINVSSLEMDIFKDRDEFYLSVLPIIISDQYLGCVLLTRKDRLFNEEDIIIGEYGATLISMLMFRLDELKNYKEGREIDEIKKSTNALSYSEKCAIIRIMEAIQEDNGIIVVSKVADSSGITRSAVVNALRKLESAGIIESRSLGMKGTMIRIINEKILDYKNYNIK